MAVDSYGLVPNQLVRAVIRSIMANQACEELLDSLKRYDPSRPCTSHSDFSREMPNICSPADTTRRLATDDEYADLIISGRNKTYNVHKAVVCTRSPYLAAESRKASQASEVSNPRSSLS